MVCPGAAHNVAAWRGVGISAMRARRARWLRPKVLPPRASMRRSYSGSFIIKKNVRVSWSYVSSDTTFALSRKKAR